MKKSWLCFILAAALSVLIPATLPAQTKIHFDLDYAIFQYNPDTLYWEIYYDVHQAALKYVPTAEGKYSAAAVVRLSLYKDQTLWYNNGWRLKDEIADTTQRNRSIVDKIKILAPPAQYSLVLFVQDLNQPAKQDSLVRDILIDRLPKDEIALSDLQLSTSIRQAPNEKNSPFYRNTLLIQPNPSRLFGPVSPALFFYLEAYHLLNNLATDDYNVRYFITDANDNQVPTIKAVEFAKKRQVDSAVEIGMVNILPLTPGAYNLKFELSDPVAQKVTVKTKKFYIAKTTTSAPVANIDAEKLYIQSRFSQMSEPEIEQEFEYINYVLRKEQKATFLQLQDVDKKRRFLFDFWYSHDPTKDTVRNEFRDEYLKRIEYGNQYYSAFGKEGWKTDRGRVYIIYGPPTNVELYTSSGDTKPYEIWNYDQLQGGVIFVFADLSGMKDYILLHSTLRGETYNPDYMKQIKQF